MQNPSPTRCLILGCGNPLRSDDGVGPWLISWAQEQFHDRPDVRAMYRQQWTPELTDDIAHAESVIFIDASNKAAPGAVEVHRVLPSQNIGGLATHHLSASQLIALCNELYDATPRNSVLLTIGVQSTDFGDKFSRQVHAALQQACDEIEKLVDTPEADIS